MNFNEKPSEERIKSIEDSFLKKGIIDFCSQCNKEGGTFYFTDGQLFLGLSESMELALFQVVIRICGNCGHVTQYGSGYLEPENLKDD